jgi:hypothetical protein
VSCNIVNKGNLYLNSSYAGIGPDGNWINSVIKNYNILNINAHPVFTFYNISIINENICNINSGYF